ncbi:MAG: SRPBCC domain-containing protein [Trueperaceae bacterium]
MTSTKGTDLSLQVERVISASPERAYRAWTDPQRMKSWFAPSEEMAVEAEVDLRVGGKYRVSMGPYVVHGVYQEVAPARRLVFSWQWRGETPSNDMLVTVEFLEHPTGTRVLITHDRLADEDSREQHTNGWTAMLSRLESLSKTNELD